MSHSAYTSRISYRQRMLYNTARHSKYKFVHSEFTKMFHGCGVYTKYVNYGLSSYVKPAQLLLLCCRVVKLVGWVFKERANTMPEFEFV